ncbi:MAG: HAMP domain-containing protein, partial [Sandaracinaceae bacterium]|nr:HAMP domain-containing protein [Sandaracinaceae bacterium]
RRLAPLGVLTGRAQAIAAGDRSPLPADLVSGPGDEIRELAVAFGAMVEGVASRDADLSRLRRRQEDIVNHLRAAVVALRADGVVEAADAAARELLAVREGDDLARSPLWELVSADVAHAIEKGVEPAPRPAVTLGALVLDVRVVPMRSGEGRLALLVVDDVSEAAQARARALQAERLAAIGKMAAHITHEIRNPLSSMQLNLELLDETIRDDAAPQAKQEAVRLVTAIAREVERLADVSEEYLRVARLPSPRPSTLDLVSLVQDVASFAGPELERARVHVDLELPSSPLVVAVDEAQVRQALVNLVRNAREAMEDGGTITLRVLSEAKTAVLEVEDQGPGMDEEVRRRIFDPFFTTKATGTGLGLPLTRQIVEAHGGTIACDPVEPHGTRFRLAFPRTD